MAIDAGAPLDAPPISFPNEFGTVPDPARSARSAAQSAARPHVARPYFPWFDWLRFTLACTVMLYHFGFLNVWSHSGGFAVQVFFALSGWLIGGILLDTKPSELPHFYFNRVVRIWAPYYLALAFLLTASLLREPVTGKWIEFVFYKSTFVWNVFGTQQLAEFRNAMPLKATGNHFWSVNAEEQFYLLSPLVLVWMAPGLGRRVLTWVVISAVACAADLYGAITLGVLAAVVQRKVPGFHARPVTRVALLGVLIGCIALFRHESAYVYAAPFAGVAIVLLLAVEGRRTRIGALAGGLSYPLYLNHWIGGFIATVLLLPFGLGHTAAVQLPIGICLNISLAAGLYWWIDRRLLARRSAWATPARGRLAMAASYGLVSIGLLVGLIVTRLLKG